MWYEGEESRTGTESYCELNWTDACVVPVRVPSLSPVHPNPPVWLEVLILKRVFISHQALYSATLKIVILCNSV